MVYLGSSQTQQVGKANKHEKPGICIQDSFPGREREPIKRESLGMSLHK